MLAVAAFGGIASRLIEATRAATRICTDSTPDLRVVR